MMYVAVHPDSLPELGAHRRRTVGRFFSAIETGDYEALHEVLTPDAITRWPQSAERITGAMSCVKVYGNYPGGPPTARVKRISGNGELWVAELVAQNGDESWHIVSVIEFEGLRIARMTDYFGPSFPAPEWREQWVEHEDATPQSPSVSPA